MDYNKLQQKKNIPFFTSNNVRLPSNITDLNSCQPTLRLTPLKLYSASSFHLPSTSINSCFHTGPKVLLTPLKKSIQRQPFKYKLSFNRRRKAFPSITKCNSKKCLCCNYLSCKSTIKSNTNGRVFSVNFISDID